MTGPLTLSAHLSNGAAISRAVGDRFPSEDGGRSDRREGRSLPVSLSSPAPDAGVRGTRGQCRRRHCEKHAQVRGSGSSREREARMDAGSESYREATWSETITLTEPCQAFVPAPASSPLAQPPTALERKRGTHGVCGNLGLRIFRLVLCTSPPEFAAHEAHPGGRSGPGRIGGVVVLVDEEGKWLLATCSESKPAAAAAAESEQGLTSCG